MMNRRTLLQAGIAGSLGLTMPVVRQQYRKDSTTLGLIADLHHGLEPTALSRLEAFMAEVETRQPDSILQMGDFNYGKPDSRECMQVWNQFDGPKYHVLGNHDLDFYDKPHMLDAWQMPHPYYSFDQGGWHFVVIDRNHLFHDGKTVDYQRGNYYVDASQRGFADPEQLEWLKQDLSDTELPTVVFSHQGLGMRRAESGPAEASRAIESVLAQANFGQKTPRVVACFCGHHHVDRYHFRDQIHYVWVNSASYHWVGEKYGRRAVYKEPLFCFTTFCRDGSIQIDGRQSEWQPPTPKQRGYPDADRVNTHILDRSLAAGRKSSNR